MHRELNTAGSWHLRTCRIWLALCGSWLIAHGALAQSGEGLTVRVEEGDTLRDLAAEHLGDPDLWTEILRANGLSAITDVRPGLDLRIAPGEVQPSKTVFPPRITYVGAWRVKIVSGALRSC